jgi:hypothetical protein
MLLLDNRGVRGGLHERQRDMGRPLVRVRPLGAGVLMIHGYTLGNSWQSYIRLLTCLLE